MYNLYEDSLNARVYCGLQDLLLKTRWIGTTNLRFFKDETLGFIMGYS